MKSFHTEYLWQIAAEPWGASLNAAAGDTVTFNMTYQGPSWSGDVANSASGVNAPSTFPLLGQSAHVLGKTPLTLQQVGRTSTKRYSLLNYMVKPGTLVL